MSPGFRRLRSKGVWISRQQNRMSVQAEVFIGPNETFHQPRTHKTGPTSNEDLLTPKSLPKLAGVRKDVIQVFLQRMRHASLKGNELRNRHLMENIEHIGQHLGRNPRVHSDPEDLIHDEIGVFE